VKTKNKIVQNIPDEKIMENVKGGNLTEMSILFERYHLKLYNFFFRMGINRDISQDMTQNLFYRMIRYRHTYKEGACVKSWIYQIARNLHSDYCNGEKRKGDLFVKSGIFPSDIAETNDSYHEDDFERLDMALMTLSDTQRELIVLSRYQGLKYEEISSIVNQTVPAIKVSIYRAIRQLRCVYFKQS